MTIIEAFEAAKADGMFYASNDDWTDIIIENHIEGMREFFQVLPPPDDEEYIYRDGGIYRVFPPDGTEEEVYFCQTADEVHAERERDEDDE